MKQADKEKLLNLLRQYEELRVNEQIDYDKFYLYSIITHSTAIEGSTVTELEAQLLFDEGITSNKRTMIEQLMNLDLKVAYDFGMKWIQQHEKITVDNLILLASKVMARTGGEYHTMVGDFSAARGELRKFNVTAGFGGSSYMSYLKVPSRLEAFCSELNRRREYLNPTDIAAIYELSFWAHYELVTIHPWVDGNGRTSRLLMNLLQMEFDVLPTKVLKEDRAEYIQALVRAREDNNCDVFIDYMTLLHCQHLQQEIDHFMRSMGEGMVDKEALKEEIIGKWSIKPSLAAKLVDIIYFANSHQELTTELITREFQLTPTTAKRYLRQLVSFGFLQSEGANRNRKYRALGNSKFIIHNSKLKPLPRPLSEWRGE